MSMGAFSNESGDFVFSLGDNTALNGIDEVAGAGFNSSPILNGKPRQDFTGDQLRQIQLKGVAYGPNGTDDIEHLFKLKDSNKPVVYVQAGKNRGQWIIKQVRKSGAEVQLNGVTMKNMFTVQLEEFANV